MKFQIAGSRFYAGVVQRFISAEISPANISDLTGGILPPEFEDELTRLLTISTKTSGVGITAEYDTRDNFFSPSAGIRYQFNHLWYDDTFGSDIEYQLTELSGLHYLPITEKWRSGFRVEVNYANADQFLPTYATPAIKLRGIPAQRYQGNAVVNTELEIVYKINNRFDVNVFGGVGYAANEWGELSDAKSRVAKGAGFRYLIARRYGFKMGVDVAKGPEESVFYIQAGSAW